MRRLCLYSCALVFISLFCIRGNRFFSRACLCSISSSRRLLTRFNCSISWRRETETWRDGCQYNILSFVPAVFAWEAFVIHDIIPQYLAKMLITICTNLSFSRQRSQIAKTGRKNMKEIFIFSHHVFFSHAKYMLISYS